MLINEHVAIFTDRIILVPYSRHHVTTYHDWMKDPDIQAATASEPLSLKDEYSMQQSWRSDSDKLTFILCRASSRIRESVDHVGEIAMMVGDVNMFVSGHEEEDGGISLVGELELMIASKTDQGKGLGGSALLTFLLYVLKHQKEIIGQFHDQILATSKNLQFDYFVVKVNEQNGRSLALFEKMGFKKISEAPNFFGEYELRLSGLSVVTVKEMLSKHGVGGYLEVEYRNEVDGESVHLNGH